MIKINDDDEDYDEINEWYTEYYKIKDSKPWNISYSQDSVIINDEQEPQTSSSSFIFPSSFRKPHFIVEYVDEPIIFKQKRSNSLFTFNNKNHENLLSTTPTTLNQLSPMSLNKSTMNHSKSVELLNKHDYSDCYDNYSTLNNRLALKYSCKLHNCQHKNSFFINNNNDENINNNNNNNYKNKNINNKKINRFNLFFKIWKDQFILENQCNDDTFIVDCICQTLPYLFKIFIALFYITIGALLYQLFDVKLEQEPYYKVLLFTFTTVTTIGYGNIVPTTDAGYIFTVLYIFFGVPTVFLVLSSFGEILSRFYWIFITCLMKKRKLITNNPKIIPPYIGMTLLHGHSIIGALLFKYWFMSTSNIKFIDAYYFCFISITTIGYGDISPEPESLFESIIMIIYLAFGIIILSAFINSLIQVIRRLHYIGRKFSGAQHVEVYFAGAKFTIKELLQLVSLQFDVSPQQVKDIIYELDDIINLADSNNLNDTTTPDDSEYNDDTIMSPNSLQIQYRDSPQNQKSLNGSITSRKTNYTSKFSDAEQLKLIQAVSTICHLSDTGNRSFRSNSSFNIRSN